MYKVLLVDDEYMITEGLKKLIPFDHWNMEVVATAEDADQALDYVREHPVDVVITDVNMPGKTGLQMIAEIKDLQYQMLLLSLCQAIKLNMSRQPSICAWQTTCSNRSIRWKWAIS